jgi:hypothetical protein
MGGFMSSIVISGDTSGSVALTVPAVAGTNTVTIPAATGTVMVTGNMPAFSAYLGTNQSVTSQVATKILYNTENFDTNNNFASSRFTPTVAGYYYLTAGADFSSTTGISRFIIIFYKNGVEFTVPVDYSVNVLRATTSQFFYLNGTTDYVEVYVYISGVTPVALGNQTTSFSGFLARSA